MVTTIKQYFKPNPADPKHRSLCCKAVGIEGFGVQEPNTFGGGRQDNPNESRDSQRTPFSRNPTLEQ